MENLGLGKIIEAERIAHRDAVHVAVAPVVAAQDLDPGDPVGLDRDSGEAHFWDAGDGPIGIVDPFLTDRVKKGQRFWLFLYPGTVTSLRHVWQHPAFRIKLPSFEEVLRDG